MFSSFKVLSKYPTTELSGKSKKIAYPPLYKENRIWQAGFEVLNDTTADLITHYGVIDGKMQTSHRDTTKKVKRSVYDQGLQDLNHKYHLKIKKEGFEFKDENVMDAPKNTRPFPMAAHTFGPDKKVEYPIFVQPKLDGVRMLIDIEDGLIRYSSRERSDYSHLGEVFQADAECLFEHLPPNSILDGELIFPSDKGEDFQIAVSAARKSKGGISDHAKNNLIYAIFAFYTLDDLSLQFDERHAIITEAFDKCKPKKMVNVPTFVASDEKEMKKAFNLFLAKGHEGLMIYNPKAPYEPDKRSNNLLKLKMFKDKEGLIVGVKAGKGREKNAALVDIDVGDGRIVTMHPTGTIEEREEWLKHPEKIIGKRMTYTYQDETKDGLPRFPVARVIRDYE